MEADEKFKARVLSGEYQQIATQHSSDNSTPQNTQPRIVNNQKVNQNSNSTKNIFSDHQSNNESMQSESNKISSSPILNPEKSIEKITKVSKKSLNQPKPQKPKYSPPKSVKPEFSDEEEFSGEENIYYESQNTPIYSDSNILKKQPSESLNLEELPDINVKVWNQTLENSNVTTESKFKNKNVEKLRASAIDIKTNSFKVSDSDDDDVILKLTKLHYSNLKIMLCKLDQQ